MASFLRLIDRSLCALITSLVRGVKLELNLALWLEHLRRRIPRGLRRWRGSLRRLVSRLFVATPPVATRRRRPWNRTPEHIEEQLVRLHVEQPQLGAGGLGRLAGRVLAFNACRETVRKILGRRRDLVVALEQQRRRRPRRIVVASPRLLWGLDLTLVWLLGIIPIWLLGVIDYHGSRLVCLCLLPWPTSSAVARMLDEVFRGEGKPVRLLTDNGSVFTSSAFETFLAGHDVKHSRIRPAHPWTNGRIERLFRTFKETVAHYTWTFTSLGQIDRWCADFQLFYNRDRPHSSHRGLTPDEVASGAKAPAPARGRATYFDGRLKWYTFG